MNKRTIVGGQHVIVNGSFVRTARLAEEWYEDVVEPASLISGLAGKADIVTFWQRLPDTTPHYSHYMECDEVAALPITTYEHWWSAQIKSRTRGLIRKSEKQGVVVREVDYTDEFVRGMTEIFNETPMRQGRPFWHYGKTFETVKREFSRYLFREKLIGAFQGEELIGFMMIGMAGNYAVTGQIISKVRDRDKAPNNIMIAKAVEVCAREKIPYLVYLRWGSGSLSEFKRRNGFERIALPRYYVPLNGRGRLALRFGLHKGLAGAVPESMLRRLKRLRTQWFRAVYSLRYRGSVLAEAEL
jgi:hypothetical protein